MNTKSEVLRLLVAAGGAVLMVGACDQMKEPAPATEQSVREAERVAREAQRVAREAERVAHEAERVAQEERAAREAERVARAVPPTATATLAVNEAVSSIATARCERERRCENIGSGKRYSDTQACLAAVRTDFSDDLTPTHCNAGVNRPELTQCMEEIRNEDCGNPIETLERVAACRTASLCHTAPAVSLR